jgi:hypothetical protein
VLFFGLLFPWRLFPKLNYVSADITIIDDIAHSPEKAQAILETIRRIYQGNIVAIFEPNIGGRERAAAHKYQGVFTAADTVYIPRLSKLKTAAENTGELPMDGAALTATIGESHPHAFFIEVYDNSDAIFVAFVADISDAFDFFIFDQVSYFFEHGRFVHAVWNFSDDDLETAGFGFNDFGFTAGDYPAFASGIGIFDSILVVNDAASWKVRSFHYLADVFGG